MSNTASLVLWVVYSVKNHHDSLKCLRLSSLKKTCVRQVVLDKWFPLKMRLYRPPAFRLQVGRGGSQHVAGVGGSSGSGGSGGGSGGSGRSST